MLQPKFFIGEDAVAFVHRPRRSSRRSLRLRPVDPGSPTASLAWAEARSSHTMDWAAEW
jgi:hypothetical protein